MHALINTGHREVVDADLSGYFDSIQRKELMQSVARRICDRQMLKLIKMWLHTPVVEDSNKDRDEPKGGGKRGTPQGSPISPLLANLYFRRFIMGWRKLGPKQCQGRIVSYADDFVICCQGEAGKALQATREILGRLGLKLNETKTCVRRLPEESLDFLGYTLGICHRARSGVPYLGTRPSKKSMGKICREIHRETRSWSGLRSPEQEVARLNRMLVGWANYFCLGGVSKAYRAVDAHTRWRLRQWLRRKHKKQGSKGTRQFPDQFLYERLGLVRLTERTRDLPWAKA